MYGFSSHFSKQQQKYIDSINYFHSTRQQSERLKAVSKIFRRSTLPLALLTPWTGEIGKMINRKRYCNKRDTETPREDSLSIFSLSLLRSSALSTDHEKEASDSKVISKNNPVITPVSFDTHECILLLMSS